MACVAGRPKRGSSGREGHVPDPVLSDGAASYTPSISERRGTATTFLHSGIKNADAQSNASGSVSGTRVYDAFGAELSSTGSWQGAFGYAGGFGYQEDANGLKLLGHRYYDPSTGRFLTRDPIKDGRNWYAYCENDPLRRVDPFGLFAASTNIGAALGKFSPPVEVPLRLPSIIPRNVDIERNAEHANYLKHVSHVGMFTWIAPDKEFYDLVKPGGSWDYKLGGPEYEDFGNFHFGVVAAAYGIEEEVGLRGAGLVQMKQGHSKGDWGKPWEDPPYGDDPRDQYWIKQGYRYYREAWE